MSGHLSPRVRWIVSAHMLEVHRHLMMCVGGRGCLPRVHAPFGDLTTAQWVHMSRIRCRTVGRSATVPVFLTRSGVLLKMRICGEIRIPAPLVLRGEASNFLLLETAMKMTVRGPKENLVVIPGCGHAPALMAGRSGRNHRGWLAIEPR